MRVVGIRGRSLDGRRHPTRIVPAFDDTFRVYPRPGKPFAGKPFDLAGCTHPWQERDEDRRAKLLSPGRYVAVPIRANAEGKVVEKGGRPCFALAFKIDGRGQTVRMPSTSAGIYPESLMGPHIGCQVLRDQDWTAFLLAVGTGLPFEYELIDWST